MCLSSAFGYSVTSSNFSGQTSQRLKSELQRQYVLTLQYVEVRAGWTAVEDPLLPGVHATVAAEQRRNELHPSLSLDSEVSSSLHVPMLVLIVE